MATKDATTKDRVRENSGDETNMKIDQKVIKRIYEYRSMSRDEITAKLVRLYHEWDIERALEVNIASMVIVGTFLGFISHKRWFALPVLAASFLAQHSIQGWCPSVAVLRRMGFRTRQEIDQEIYILKALRGDFDNISADSDPIEIIAMVRH